MVTFAGTLRIFFPVFSFWSFEIFGLTTHSVWIMQEWISHKLLFNHFHSWHNIGTITLLKQSDPFLLEIDLLFTLSATFRWILIASALILYGVEPTWLVTIHNSYGSMRLTSLEKWILIPLNVLDYPLSFCGHLWRVNNFVFKPFNNRQNVVGFFKNHRDIWIIPRWLEANFFLYSPKKQIKNWLLFVTYLIVICTGSLSDNNAVCWSMNNLLKIMLMVEKGFVYGWCSLSSTAFSICFWGLAPVAGNSLSSVSCHWTLTCSCHT